MITESFKDDLRYFWYSHPSIKSKLKLVTCPILWPCYLCNSIANCSCTPKHVRERQKRSRILSEISQRRRERALQNRKRSPSIDQKRAGATNRQGQSPLFAVLPVELRLTIYEMVLCETGRVHVRWAGTPNDRATLKSMTCVEPDKISTGHDLCVGWGRGQKTLNVLLTCRRIYREAVDILYSGNVFSFCSPNYFRTFSKSVLPHRLDKIREIIIEYTSKEGRTMQPQYFGEILSSSIKKALATISSMHCLQKVCLSFNLNTVNDGIFDYGQSSSNIMEAATTVSPNTCRFYLFVDVHGPKSESWYRVDAVTQKPMLLGRWPLQELISL